MQLHPFEPMDPDKEPEPERWLVPGLLMQGKINVIFGAEKAGKSRLLSWMLVHMLYKLPLWGHDDLVAPERILYLLGEETQAIVGSRLLDYARILKQSPAGIDWHQRITFVEAAGMRLDQAAQRDWLRIELTEGGYDTLIVDPLRRVHGAKESSNDEMSKICNSLREWSNKDGLTEILLHHTGKLTVDDDTTRIATWSRGATDLPAVLDWAVFLDRHTNGRAYDTIRVIRKGRAASRADLKLADSRNHLWEQVHG